MMNQALDTTAAVQERLADNEIARIVTALGNAEFKAGTAPNFTTDQSFRPRSLLEIAALAQSKAGSDVPQVTTPEEEQNEHQTKNQKEIDGVIADSLITDEKVENTIAGQQDSTANPTADTKANNDTTGSEDETVGLNELGVDAPTATNDGDGLVKQKAYDSGYADGEEAGRLAALAQMKAETETAVRAELHEKLQAFDLALSALLSYDKDQIASFSDEIQTLVLELTTQRMGIAIAELPEKFIGKIEALAEQIGRHLADAEIHLNAADMEQIKPLMEEHGSKYRFVPDPTMVHGDIKLVVGGVEIEDRIGVIDKKPVARSQEIGVKVEEQPEDVSGDIALTTVPNREDPADSGEQSDEEPSGIVLTTVPNRDESSDSGEQSDEEPSGIVLTTVPNSDESSDSGEQSDEEPSGIVLTTVPNRDESSGSGEQSDEEPSGIVLTTVPNRDESSDSGEQSDEEPSGIVLTTVPNRDDPNDPL